MPFQPRLRRFALPMMLLPLLASLGCIRSRVHISSEPAGAEVVFNGKPRGATPITIPFIWYWHHDVKVSKPGYETVEKIERFRTPPWFMMPLDLFMEIIPFPFPDNRYRSYTLVPTAQRESQQMNAPAPAGDTASTTKTAALVRP